MEYFEHLETKVDTKVKNEVCKNCKFTANSTESLNAHMRDKHVFAKFFPFLNDENERTIINVQEISNKKNINVKLFHYKPHVLYTKIILIVKELE